MKTKRTRLRRFQLSDFENMRKLESDADIMKFTPARVPFSSEQTRSRLETLIKKETEYHPYGVWAVENIHDQDFIGWFMLLKTDLEFPELGFMIVQKYWGQGLSVEISEAIINYGFKTLEVQAITARTDHNNHISIRVLEKLGFKQSTTITKDNGDILKVFKLLP